MREGTLINRRVKLPIPNNSNLNSDFLRNYAKNWVENTFGAGDYFCRTPEVDPTYYKLVNYEIEVNNMYAENKIALTTVTVHLVFKKLDDVAFIDINKLGW